MSKKSKNVTLWRIWMLVWDKTFSPEWLLSIIKYRSSPPLKMFSQIVSSYLLILVYYIVFFLCRVQFVSATRPATKESTVRKVGGGNKTKWLLSASVIKLSASVRTTQLIFAPGVWVLPPARLGVCISGSRGTHGGGTTWCGLLLILLTPYTSHDWASVSQPLPLASFHAYKIHDRKWWSILMR